MGNLFNGTSFPVWRKSSTLHVLGVSSYKKRCMNAVRCKKIARWLKLQNIPSLFWLHMEKALWEQTTDESIALKLVRQQEAKGLWDCTLYNHVCYQAWWPEFDLRTPTMEGERWLPWVVLWPPHLGVGMWSHMRIMCGHTWGHMHSPNNCINING